MHFSITISVNPSDCSEDFSLHQVSAKLTEKVLQVCHANITLIILVDCSESSIKRVVWLSFQILDHELDSLDKVNLMLDYPHQAHLHINGKRVESTHS